MRLCSYSKGKLNPKNIITELIKIRMKMLCEQTGNVFYSLICSFTIHLLKSYSVPSEASALEEKNTLILKS